MPVPLFAPRRVHPAGGPEDVPAPKAPPRLWRRGAASRRSRLRPRGLCAGAAGDGPVQRARARVVPRRSAAARDQRGPTGWAPSARSSPAPASRRSGSPRGSSRSSSRCSRRRCSTGSVRSRGSPASPATWWWCSSSPRSPRSRSPAATAFGAMPLGGAVGELFGEVLRTLFSSIGSYIIGLTIVALILIGRATFSFIEWVKRLERRGGLPDRARGAWMRAFAGAWAAARAIDNEARRGRPQSDGAAHRRAHRATTPSSPPSPTMTTDDLERRSMEIAVVRQRDPPCPALRAWLTRRHRRGAPGAGCRSIRRDVARHASEAAQIPQARGKRVPERRAEDRRPGPAWRARASRRGRQSPVRCPVRRGGRGRGRLRTFPRRAPCGRAGQPGPGASRRRRRSRLTAQPPRESCSPRVLATGAGAHHRRHERRPAHGEGRAGARGARHRRGLPPAHDRHARAAHRRSRADRRGAAERHGAAAWRRRSATTA